MSDLPSWIPPQAPTYTSNCAALSEAELVELMARALRDRSWKLELPLRLSECRELARVAIGTLRLAGAMK